MMDYQDYGLRYRGLPESFLPNYLSTREPSCGQALQGALKSFASCEAASHQVPRSSPYFPIITIIIIIIIIIIISTIIVDFNIFYAFHLGIHSIMHSIMLISHR